MSIFSASTQALGSSLRLGLIGASLFAEKFSLRRFYRIPHLPGCRQGFEKMISGLFQKYQNSFLTFLIQYV